MQRRRLLGTAAATAALAGLGLPRPVRAAGAPIRIGSYVSATGPNSFLGDPEAKTLRIYVDAINAAGGVRGRPLALSLYDDGGDTAQSRSFALRLVNQDNVLAVVGGTNTGTTMAAIPVFQDAEIPFISCSGAIVIVEPVKKWVFKMPATDRIAAQATFIYMKSHGITKVGMLNGSDGYGQSGTKQSQIAAKELGIDLVISETYAPSDSDMTAQLTRIRSSGAQALLNFGIGAGPSIIARNVKQLGMNIPLYLSPAIASDTFLRTTGAAAEGVYVPVDALLVADKLPDADPQKQVCLDYAKFYQDHAHEKASYGGGTAYDGLMILKAALERVIDAGQKLTPANIRDEIEKTRGFVGTDGIFTMSPTDHMGLDAKAFLIAVVRNNDWYPA